MSHRLEGGPFIGPPFFIRGRAWLAGQRLARFGFQCGSAGHAADALPRIAGLAKE
jgi:hypothetical protein